MGKRKSVHLIMDLGNDAPEVWAVCATRAIAERVLANYEIKRKNDGQSFYDDEWEIETFEFIEEMPEPLKRNKVKCEEDEDEDED